MTLEQMKSKIIMWIYPISTHGLDHSLEAEQASSNMETNSANSLSPLSLPLEARSKRAIFYGEDVNETPMLGTSSTNSLGLGTLHFAEPKPRSTATACLVAQDDLNHVKHACDRSFASRSTNAIS